MTADLEHTIGWHSARRSAIGQGHGARSTRSRVRSGAQRLGAGYRDLIGDLDPELLEEIEGIAAGSGRHVNEILALNSRTEILPPTYPGQPHPDWHSIAACKAAGGVPDWRECTSIAIKPSMSATGTTLLAQNWNWLGAQRAALVLLRVTESDGWTCLTLTEAGMLAKIGLNSHGFGVCLNSGGMDFGARVMEVTPDLPSRVSYEPVALAAESVSA